MNVRKTKHMVIERNKEEHEANLKIITRCDKNYEFERVDKFTYLRFSFEQTGDERQTVQVKSNQKYESLLTPNTSTYPEKKDTI